MQNYCKSLVLILIVIIFNSCALASSEKLPPSPVSFLEKFDLDEIPISNYRIFKIPATNDRTAEKILGQGAHALLNTEQLQLLFPRKYLGLDKALKHELRDAMIYAQERKEISEKNPNDRDFYEIAKKYQDYASYTKTLKPPLYPYLVKAKVYAEGTGAFSVSLKKNTLDVYHGSLSQRDLPEHYVYIVVFVERKIDSVVVNAGYSS